MRAIRDLRRTSGGVCGGILFPIAFACLIVVLVAGCGGGGGVYHPPRADVNHVQYNLKDDVVILPADANASLHEDGTVEIDRPLDGLRPGSVLVSTQGTGFLRKVVNVRDDSGKIVAETQQATLEDLFKQADIYWTTWVTEFQQVIPEEGVEVLKPKEEAAPTASVFPAWVLKPELNVAKIRLKFARTLWKHKGKHVTSKFNVQGDVTVAVPVKAAIEIDWFDLKRFELAAGVSLTGDVGISLNGEAKLAEWKKEATLATVYAAPIAIGPIVLVPEGRIVTAATLDLSLKGKIKVELADVTANVMAGVKWTKDSGQFKSTFTHELRVKRPLTQAWADDPGYIKGGVKLTAKWLPAFPRAALKLYGLAGLRTDLRWGKRTTITLAECELHESYRECKCQIDLHLFTKAKPGGEFGIAGWTLGAWDAPIELKYDFHVPGFPISMPLYQEGAVPVVVLPPD